MSKDSTMNNALVKSYLEAAKKAGMNEPKNNTVGNNGYTLGQQFHSNGMKLVETEINGKKTVYVAVTTEEGIDLSVKSLMGISSLSGYETTGEFESESREAGKKVVTKIKAEVVDDFDFERVFQPACRQLLDFIAEAEENGTFDGKTITYLGKVVRPYEAKKDSPATSFETYKKGDKRAMSVKLWSVE